MAKQQLSKMTYLSGYSGRKGLLGVLAFPTDFPSGAEFTVFYTYLEGQWGQRQFPFDIASLTYLCDEQSGAPAWWLVGKRGEIVEASGGDPVIVKIPTAGTGSGDKLGYLSDIRAIAEAIFICGYRRQVYCREGGDWKLISAAIIDRREHGPWQGFESIDGTAATDVYAVGDAGEIWHFDGRLWTQCDSPTNANLACVRCIAGEMWACGDAGIILRGDRNGWDVVWSDPEPSYSWWSIEGHFGSIYVAGNSVLGVLRDGRVEVVDVGLGERPTTNALHARGGTLWSVGERHILSFDGTVWTEHQCPENQN
jgi:hypothetical protein